MRIRSSQSHDVPQLEALFLKARQQAFSWENTDQFKLEDYKKSTEGEVVFVAEDQGGEILGFISVWKDENPPFIHNLFVAPDHQRKGVGKALMRSLLPWLSPPYRLKCIAKNHEALAFYQKTGWGCIAEGEAEEGPYLLLEMTASI